jgi:hypothetical protein
MSRPVRVSVTGVGVSPVVAVDVNRDAPCSIGAAVIVNGAVTFQVQHTFDDIWSPTFNPATATWFPHPTLTGSANVDGNYMAPPTGIRLNVSAGAGTATLVVVQSGI